MWSLWFKLQYKRVASRQHKVASFYFYMGKNKGPYGKSEGKLSTYFHIFQVCIRCEGINRWKTTTHVDVLNTVYILILTTMWGLDIHGYTFLSKVPWNYINTNVCTWTGDCSITHKVCHILVLITDSVVWTVTWWGSPSVCWIYTLYPVLVILQSICYAVDWHSADRHNNSRICVQLGR